MRVVLIWTILLTVLVVPIVAATQSPLLAWRQPVYIAAGFAGVWGMSLMLLQPLLVGGHLPGFSPGTGRRLHQLTGGLILTSVLLHVGGLWITSPPDVIDVLLFRSPTPFGVWGALAMWAVFASALLALYRKSGRLALRSWRIIHTFLAGLIVAGTILHALLIEGTMETASKLVLSVLILAATIKVVYDRRVWNLFSRRIK